MTLADGDAVTGEQVLVVAKRRFDSAAVGLDAVGVAGDADWAPVDEHLRVAPGGWAVGDVAGKGAFIDAPRRRR